MTPETVMSIAYQAMMVTLYLGAPLLLTALFVVAALFDVALVFRRLVLLGLVRRGRSTLHFLLAGREGGLACVEVTCACGARGIRRVDRVLGPRRHRGLSVPEFRPPSLREPRLVAAGHPCNRHTSLILSSDDMRVLIQ